MLSPRCGGSDDDADGDAVLGSKCLLVGDGPGLVGLEDLDEELALLYQ